MIVITFGMMAYTLYKDHINSEANEMENNGLKITGITYSTVVVTIGQAGEATYR